MNRSRRLKDIATLGSLKILLGLRSETGHTTVNDLANGIAVILAGGLGTRLRPIIADRPKVLAEVQGHPFLASLLDQVAAAEIKTVVLCTGYLGEQVRETFGNTYKNLHLVYSQESSPLGTAGALRFAFPLFASDTVLVMNGDSFCEADLNAFWSWHCVRGAEATILLTEVADTRRYGRVQVDMEGRVLGFEEKGDANGPGWVNAGIYLFKRCMLETIPVDKVISLEREVFPAWIGGGLYGYRSEGRFLDIGTPESYTMAEQFFAPETLA
jgi:NDP-sugar pyrophosphorylase family protein